LLLLLGLGIFAISCNSTERKGKKGTETELQIQDLPEIIKSGKIRVVTNYNSTNYFVYKGQPMGYQFELLQEFANFMD
jgi:membrane-bound lytic murein transglycosylase F